jgi:hypothetical protein
MPANVWLRDLHTDLHLGEVGRLYSEVAASWLPVIVVSGLVLWVGKQGRRRRGIRELLVPVPRGKGEQARMRSVHGPLGIWLTAGLLVMSVTGLAMSRFAGWGLPAVRAPELAVAPVGVPGNVEPIGVDRVLQVARAQGLSGELEVAAPTAPDRPYTVVEKSVGLPIRKDSIAIDPYTAEVTGRVGWDDYPFLAQVREVGVQAHTGTLFGPANQIVLALLVIATIVAILIGYRMWWKRSPYQEGKLPPVPPPALRQLTASAGVPVVLVTVVLAWLMPAFGVSLAAFVVVDLVINAFRQRQERLRRTVTAGALLVAGSVLGVAVLVDTPSPVTRVDAVGTFPGQRTPGGTAPDAGAAPLDLPPLAEQAVPDVAAGTGAPPTPRPVPGVRAGAPAGPAPAPPGSGAGTDGPDDPTAGGDQRAGGGSSGSHSGRGGGSDDTPGSDNPGPSESAGEIPGGPEDPVGNVPEPEPPPTEAPSDDDPPGVVAGLVGTLSEAAKPVVDTVRSVAGGLLGG